MRVAFLGHGSGRQQEPWMLVGDMCAGSGPLLAAFTAEPFLKQPSTGRFWSAPVEYVSGLGPHSL